MHPDPTPTLPGADLKFTVDVGPGIDLEQWRLTVPAKPGCYLLTDVQGTPVLMGTAANMRNVLVHRLTAPPADDGPSKRIDYRQVVRRIHYRPAFSRFETDWSYIANARRFHPRQLARLTRKWRGHWVHIDPTQRFPRFTTTNQPTGEAGQYFGPLPTAAAARRVVETLQDLFDLCRYHEILKQTPHGQACAYKEMGKCPAPCDGTVSMDHYHGQLADARQMLVTGIAPWIDEAKRRMAAASAALDFESAGRIKERIEEAAGLTGETFAALRPMPDHRYLLIAPGSRKHHARAFLARPDGVAFLGEIVKRDRDRQIDWLFEQVLTLLNRPIAGRLDGVGLMSWYLLRADKERLAWLAADHATDAQRIAATIDELWRVEEAEDDDSQDASSDAPEARNDNGP